MKKIEPWRLIVGLLSVGFIIYMWVRKGIGDMWSQMARGELLPLLLTNLAVTGIKILLIAGGVLLIRWLLSKIKKK